MTERAEKRGSLARWFLATAIAAGLVACCAGLVFFGHRPKNGIRVEQLEADLNKRLPYGSTWEQAEAWFASRGIEPMIIGSPNRPKAGLATIIGNSSLLETAEIRIELYFNPEGRLQKRIIYRFVYSL